MRFRARYVLAFILSVTVLATVYNIYADDFLPLNRYTVESRDRLEWPANLQPYKYRSITVKGLTEEKLVAILNARFSARRGWSHPYIERTNGFLYDVYQGNAGSSAHLQVTAAAPIDLRTEIHLEETRPLNSLETAWGKLVNHFVPQKAG